MKAFEPLAKRLGIVKKKALRNLGRELHGTTVGRYQEQRRLKALRARRRNIRILRQAAGGRVARLLRTGLLPSAAHGARVSGVADGALRELRAVAGELVGAKQAASLTTYLFMQDDASYDPVVDCTVAPIHEYSSWVWEQRGSMGRVQGAWARREPNSAKNATWALSRGPISAVWLSLLRIGWGMKSAPTMERCWVTFLPLSGSGREEPLSKT